MTTKVRTNKHKARERERERDGEIERMCEKEEAPKKKEHVLFLLFCQ